MIDRDTIDRIFAAAEVAEIVGEFVQLRRKGVNFTACCPFHDEKTPSFIVSPAKGLYKCFGCGKGGNAINFVMEHEKLTYPDALKWVAAKYSIEVKEKEMTPETKQANDDRESMMILTAWASEFFANQMKEAEGKAIAETYFKQRGFTSKTMKTFGLGYCPTGSLMTKKALQEGYQEEFLTKTGLSIKSEERGDVFDRFRERVMFPIHSVSGRVIGFGGRTMRTDKKIAKYQNSPESEIYHKSHTLYGIYFAKKSIVQKNKCILVEGYTDVIQMYQSGIENVVASSGTSLTVEQVKLIKRFAKNITVIYDGDSAGVKASLRGIDMILKEGLAVRVVPLPEGDDPDSFAKSRSSSEIERYIEDNEEDFISFKVRTLLDDSTKNDPHLRGEVIADVVRSIAVIPDAIQRSEYVRVCAELFDTDRKMLENEVRRNYASFTDGAIGRMVVDNSIKKERFTQKQSYSQAPAPAGNIDALFMDEPQPSGIETAIHELETEIINYLVKYGDKDFDYIKSPTDIVQVPVDDTIIWELDVDKIEPLNPIYRTILEQSKAILERGERVTTAYFINNENPDISQTVVNVITRDEGLKVSKMWGKFDMKVFTEEEILSSAIPKVITIYKSKMIEHQISLLQKQLQTTSDDEQMMDILSKIHERNLSRTKILNHYERIL